MAGEHTLPGLGLTGFYNLGSDGWKAGMDTNLQTLSAVTQLTVISRVASVPGSPTHGDMHILTSDQTVAIYDVSTWVYLTPVEGWIAGVQGENDHVKFNGTTWELLSTFPSLDIAGNIVVGGTVDGRDVLADGTKLDLVTVTGAVDLDAIDVRVNSLDAAVILMGSWDASVGTFPGTGAAQNGESWQVSVAGTVDGVAFNINDRVIALVDNASTTVFDPNWLIADYSDSVASVVGQTGIVTIAQIITAMNTEKLDYVPLDIAAAHSVAEGEMAWNTDDGTVDIGLKNGVVLQTGQELHIHAKASENISDGEIVYASGAVGASGKIEVSKFIADDSISEIYMLGVATQAITSGSFGYITTFGAVRGVATDGATESETWVDGTVLYASPTVAGRLTNVQPTAPNQKISVAMVVVAHASAGTLYVRPSRGMHVGDLHDVETTSPADEDTLKWATDKWVNSPAGSLSNVELAAISASKAVTAVDGFVYDTSLDSDGGAWRTGWRALASSWYWETLNTATRGARREFPAVAVIMAEADTVTIYDGDDPTLPMWMVFNHIAGNHSYITYDTRPLSSLYMINGQLSVASDHINGHLHTIDFIVDTNTRYTSAESYNGYTSIVGRNSVQTPTPSGVANAIVNSVVNDVAITVLPDAPIDEATGLPKTTKVVGTDGNGTYLASIIQNDGNVYDVAADVSATCISISISSDGELIVVSSTGTIYIWDDVGAIAADGAAPDTTITDALGTVSISEAA